MSQLAIRKFKDRPDVLEDAAATAVLIAIENISRFDGREDASAYFWQILYNAISRQLKLHHQRERRHLSIDPAMLPAILVEQRCRSVRLKYDRHRRGPQNRLCELIDS
ncbi:MAG: hypothetical protein M3O30_17465 [Planctomycetota bacterium]|nr:hypothetical protein [Planctomycetota bacterium]